MLTHPIVPDPDSPHDPPHINLGCQWPGTLRRSNLDTSTGYRL